MSLHHHAIDYLDSNLRLIPLHGITHSNKCACGDTECPATGKHPIRSNWQHQSLADIATVKEVWLDVYGCSGFGWALDSDHFVLDIDSRSGGIESLAELEKDLGINFIEACTAVVKTGGNGLHFYFKKLDSHNLGWKMPAKYKGIDIKQAGGFVVIAGSMHASGTEYDWHSFDKSDLENLAIVPEPLVAILTRTYSDHRATVQSSGHGDIDEIREMLEYITPDIDYHRWVKIGMCIHHATDGDGFAVWDAWSQGGRDYKENECARKWHSFGKNNGNPVGIGSLVEMAREAGWQPAADSSALSTEELNQIKEAWDKKKEDRVSLPSIADDADINIHNPPGLLGKINDYVYSCSVFPNHNLALACSLSVLTNIIGRKYYWPGRFSNIQPNLLVLCIAGSSVGKDSVLGASHRLLTSAGLGPAIHGRIKSEKDLLDALERNQYAMYYNDEFGYFLQRLNNAMKKGNASYLEGIIGTIMEVFTKGDKSVLLDISRKKDIRENYETLLNTLQKKIKDGEGDVVLNEKRRDRAKMLMNKFQDGFPNPFLSMFTTATPRTMELAFSGESTENGFLSRAMTFHEYETNPRPRDDYKGAGEVPLSLALQLKKVAFDKDDCPFGRVDSFDAKPIALTIDKDAQVFVDRAIDYFFDLAETQKEVGLESLPRRALDSIVKVCIALAAQDGHLTLQMARYAVKLVRSEIDKKIRRVNSTENMSSKDTNEKLDAVASRICEVCSTNSGETPAVILSKVKSSRINSSALLQMLDKLVEMGKLERIDQHRVYGGVALFKYKSIGEA